jgi:transcriptional regulator with XRE-family HTH domain
VSEDWAAVAQAVRQRMADLGLTQRELTQRAQVSKSIVREIQHDTVQRRRSERTLEALSAALDWHPQHLTAVLLGQPPPRAGDPISRPDGDIPSRLTAIEHYLREIADRLAGVDEMNGRLTEIQAAVDDLTKRVSTDYGRGTD